MYVTPGWFKWTVPIKQHDCMQHVPSTYLPKCDSGNRFIFSSFSIFSFKYENDVLQHAHSKVKIKGFFLTLFWYFRFKFHQLTKFNEHLELHLSSLYSMFVSVVSFFFFVLEMGKKNFEIFFPQVFVIQQRWMETMEMHKLITS